MKITIPLKAEMTPEELTALLGNNVKVAYCKRTSNAGSRQTYAYTAFNSDGDVILNQVTLIRTSLTSNTFRPSRVMNLGTYDTMWHALQVYNNLRPVSHSGGRPLQAINFPLSMIGLQFNPNLEQILYNWGRTQEIIPIYYCTYNPRNDSIELSLQDPNARNSSERMRVIEQGVFTELKRYLEKHPEVGAYDKEAMDQILDPNYLDMAPRSVFRDMANQS